jgi:membrane protease YdiL (CAAX protease family)
VILQFIWFYLIACVITAACTALIRVSLAFGLLGLFGPAIAAIVVTAATEGGAGVRALLATLRFRGVGLGWYVAAILLTEAVSLVAASATIALGEPGTVKPMPIDGLKIALFVMVVGEEIGWRGFALPRLLARWRALPASLILGVLWAIWHLPTFFLQGTAQSHFPFPAYVVYTSALSVLFTWFFFRTEGSVLFAWFLHGAVNTFLFWNSAANPVLMNWMQTVGYVLAAGCVVVFAGPPFRKR